MADSSLWARAEAASRESRRLAEARRRILEEMADIVSHRQIVALEADRRVRAVELSFVTDNAPRRRAGLPDR
jgi:hypothetical protein